ncbi:phage protease [Actinomadura sp. GTD37]|uniref:phage protease n=1 Tax=Actinomadura sp. GTD37 TaxID=1778030 RepID=UPI0035C10B5F
MTDPAPEVTVMKAPPLITVPAVELMHTGQWPISTGIANFTPGDLQNAVAALACPAVRRPVLKLGHDEPDPDEQKKRWDGEPAVGYITNMATVDGGQTLIGDYAGMPSWLGGEVLASAYPDRSIEGTYDFRCQIGHTHPFVITAVALLGVVAPGIGTLQSLQDVAALYGVTDPGEQVAAAAGPDPVSGPSFTLTVHAARQEASMPNPNPAQVRAGVTTDDVRRAFYDSDYGKSWDIWICEIQLGPDLQIIAIDDTTGKLQRIPVTLAEGDGEDAVEFADPVTVVVRYEDAQVAASAGRQVVAYASRAESRPGQVRAETVSDTAWADFTAADYDITQWKKACLIDTGEGEEDSKDRYKVPVREPDGTLNRNGVHAAAGAHGISAVKGIDDAAREKAAKALVKLYQDELDEDPPESLLKLAGMDDDTTTNASAAAARPGSKNTPAPVRAGGTTGKEGAAMDAAKLREALGLSPEASDDEVRAALAEQGVTPAQPPTEDPANEPGEGEGTEGGESETAPAEPVTQQATTALPPGTVAIDETALNELREQAQQGVAARAQQKREARDRTLSDAVKAGKFPPARKEHWETYWERDEEGARQALASLAPGLVPVEDAGQPGGELTNEAVDAEFDRLFPTSPKARS